MFHFISTVSLRTFICVSIGIYYHVVRLSLRFLYTRAKRPYYNIYVDSRVVVDQDGRIRTSKVLQRRIRRNNNNMI